MSRQGAIFLATVVLFGATACASVELDPFSRPYDDKNLMAPGPIKSCSIGSDTAFTAPELEFGTKPLYPIGGLMDGKMGSARVTFAVAENGKLTVLEYESADSKWFANHAAIAMRDWRVKPATKNGVPVAVRCRLSFQYVLAG